MGCALRKQLLHRKINPEKGTPTEKPQDEENCLEGEIQSMLSGKDDAHYQQGEPCDQKSSSQQPVNAWQLKDQAQESKHIDGQQSPPRTPTRQPTGLDNQNRVEHSYDQFLPNQPLFKDYFEVEDNKKQVHLNDTAPLSLSYVRPEDEEQTQHKLMQNSQSQLKMLDSKNEKQNQQGQICQQGPAFTPDLSRFSGLETDNKPEPINVQRAPPESRTCPWQKIELKKEAKLEKELDQSPSFKTNLWKHNELERETKSSNILEEKLPTEGSGSRWQNEELIEGNHLELRHEKMKPSQPNTWQWNGPERKTSSTEVPVVEISSQSNTPTWPKSELEEEKLSQGISQRASSKSSILDFSNIESDIESPFQQNKSITEKSKKPEKILDEDIPLSGTSARQQVESEQEQQISLPQICQPCELLQNGKRGEDLPVEGPSRVLQSSLPENQYVKDKSCQYEASPKIPPTWKMIKLDKTKPLIKRESTNQMASLVQSETVDFPSRIQLPEAWLPMPNPEESFHTVRLLPDSHEFEAVMEHLKSANDKVSVEKIERIQNPEVYRQYTLRKKEMFETIGGRNEMLLFHAADNGSMPAIMKHGFSRKSCSVQKKAYGRGLYFCKDALYSIGYTGGSDVRYLYLARVLVGQYCQGNSLMILPPPKQSSIPECLYESVVDNTENPSIFVVFYSSQCYPDYLITMKQHS